MPFANFSKNSNQNVASDENDLNIPEFRQLTTGRKNTYSLTYRLSQEEKETLEDFYDNTIKATLPFLINRPDNLSEFVEVQFTSNNLAFEHQDLSYFITINLRET